MKGSDYEDFSRMIQNGIVIDDCTYYPFMLKCPNPEYYFMEWKLP